MKGGATIIRTIQARYTRSDLARDAAIRLPRGRGERIVRVERGRVLVTREGDPEDHVLDAGDELVLPRHGVAVAWAFTDATISTLEPSERDEQLGDRTYH